MRNIKLFNKGIFPKGEWRIIAYSNEKVNDDNIYFYVEKDELDLSQVKKGDKIMLDEECIVLDIE